jgi:uncharacterized protein YebE (UPF0316 family)
MQPLLGALLIFVARLVNVALSTLRMLFGMRGQKALSTGLSFFEALIFILVIGQVLQDVNNVWNVIAYSSGFAAGTLVGLWIEGKIALGYATIRVISQDEGDEMADALRRAGYGVTEEMGEGRAGQVCVLTTVAKRRRIPAIMALVSGMDENAFVTVEDASRVYQGHT